MKWNKLGNIFNVNGSNTYLLSHAANPLPVHLEGDVFRVFYSSRNKDNRSSVSYVDLDIRNRTCLYEHDQPVFVFGEEGSFLSHGISIGCVYTIGLEQYMLFMGWQIPNGQHWRGDIGRFKFSDKSGLELDPVGVFIGCDKDEISLSYPFVMYDEGIYKMWYGATTSWTSENGEMIHILKYASSVDGINWDKKGAAIPFEIGVAQAFSRPSVIKDAKGYHIWYSYRSGDGSTTYRIGYSHSKDGINWTRMHDAVGIGVSETGWDSEMICYPFVFDHDGERYMLYNGNGFGKTGFGVAKLSGL